jgi:hypothetical protein
MRSRGESAFLSKRGLSSIITTMLLVMISLVIITIIWIVLRGFVESNAESSGLKAKLLSERVDFRGVQVDAGNNLSLNVSLQKLSGSLEVSGEVTIPGSSPDVDIIVVSSVSGSMTGSYLSGAKNASWLLVNTVFAQESSSRISFVTYSTDIISAYSTGLTNDSVLLNNTINTWTAGGLEWTCHAIINATNKLLNELSLRPEVVMIVLNDGFSTTKCTAEQGILGDVNGDGTPDHMDDHVINAACNASAQIPNLKIHAVNLDPWNAEDELRAIANCGGGNYYAVYSGFEIEGIYQTIADQYTQSTTSTHGFSFLRFVFYDPYGSAVIDKDIPNILETKKYSFDLAGTGLVGPIKRIEIYPVATTSSGQEVVGNMLDLWENNG